MAKKTLLSAEPEVDQAVEQVTEAANETMPQAVSTELNMPKPEPVQAGYHSRDFGRTEKTYEVAAEQTSTPAENGGQEETQV